MEDSDRVDSSEIFFSTARRGESEQATTDIVRPSRLEGFSDAVFATAATLLVIPLKKIELEKGQSLSEALTDKWWQFLIFLIGVLIICRIWEARIIRNKIVNKVDDLLVGLSLFSLMVTTFLPFSIALESYFAGYNVSILLSSLLLLSLDLIEAFIVVYSFCMNPYLLSERIQLLDPVELKAEKYQLFVKFAMDGLLLVLAASLSYTSILASRLLILSVLTTPWLIRVFARTQCKHHCQQCQNYQSPYKLVTGSISKERIECFSDAAIAIIATLLILDLTTEEFPTKEDVQRQGGLDNVLHGMQRKFASYVAAYAVIAFMWSVNHSILHHVKVFNPKMIFINKLFLAFAACTPFITNLLQKYAGHSSENATIAIRFSAGALFAGGFCNVLLLVAAVWDKETTMYEWAWPKRRRDNRANPVHTYLFLKTLILPFVCFVTFLACLSTHYACYVTFYVAVLAVPVIFVCLKIAFACQCRTWQSPSNPLMVPRANSPEILARLPGVSEDRHISLTNRHGGINDDSDSE